MKGNRRKLHGIYVAKIFGIPVTLDYSWFFIFGLVAWSLAGGYFTRVLPGVTGPVHWLLGIGAALLLFISILLHELAHSIIARAKGIPIRGITLHVFGGVAEMKEEPADPKSELMMAAAGPVTSVALGLIFGLLTLLSSSIPYRGLFGYLFYINIVLALFNLIPGYPLDGGRILRALLWMNNGDLFKSTRWATRLGAIISLLFIVYGFILMFSSALVGGIWFVFIGFFLHHATESSYNLLVLKRGLKGMKVEDLMVRTVNTVPPDLTLQSFVDDYVLTYRHHSFPVIEGNQPLGIVTLHDLKDVPRQEWTMKTIRQVMTPIGQEYLICSKCELADAFTRAAGNGVGRLVVVDERNNFAGYLSFRDLETLLSLKMPVNL
jgi:Zn-dependent protease